MKRPRLTAALAVLLATGLVLPTACRTGSTPPTGNFTIFTIEKVTFTGVFGGTFTSTFSARFAAQSYNPYGPGLIGSVYDFLGETNREGIYRAINAVVPARWGVDQLTGPCFDVAGAITAGQLHAGEAYASVCEYKRDVAGLVNVDGDGIFFDGGCCNTDTMTAGMILTEGQTITSADHRFVLVYQGDGNLVLYQNDGTALWSSGTAGTDAGEVDMQGDGNFVIYAPGAIWASGTNSGPLSRLVVQDDGNMVIYDGNNNPVWSTNTCCH